MAKYTQAHSPLAVNTPLGEDVLLLESFTGTEEISRLFHFELDMLAELGVQVPFDKVLGQPITVSVQTTDGQKRYFSGMVSELAEGATLKGAQGDTFIRYHSAMVPQLWTLTKKVQSRIFQQLSVPDILRQVLQGLDVVFQIQGDFPARDYCVQYRESDFAFASRLMEEEGIFYFFRHSADGHQLVVTNTPSSHPDVPGAPHVHYDDVEGGTRADERVFAWKKSQRLTSGKVTLWDYCFELPDQNLEAAAEISESVTVGQVSHQLRVAGNQDWEDYDFPGRYAQRFDGISPGGDAQSDRLQQIFTDNQRTATIRMQQEAIKGMVVQGESRCRQFASGCKFELDRHHSSNGEYVLTRLEHSASLSGSYGSGAADLSLVYANKFDAIPMGLPYRPAQVTPKPMIGGTQTAVVVGPSDQEVFVDKFGRVKVQFHWDRQGKRNADSSCWIRVGQIWAGKSWGAFFWPRIGHEVIVAFEEGDPDQPVIVGSLYNSANVPPFELPSNELVNGIKSCSAGKDASADDNFNGVLFYDQLGQEHLQLHSERHETSNSETSKFISVGEEHIKIVGGMHLPGSGSGGGNGRDNGEHPSGSGSGGGDDEPFSWKGTDILGTWAKDLSLTFGVSQKSTVGMEGSCLVGTDHGIVINPIELINDLLPVAPLEAAWGVLGDMAKLAKLDLIVGATAGLHYGRTVDIHRGPNKLEGHSDLTALSVAAAALVGSVCMASNYLEMLPIHKKGSKTLKTIVDAVVSQAALAILAVVEAKVTAAEADVNQAEESVHLTEVAASAPTESMSEILIAAKARAKAMLAARPIGAPELPSELKAGLRATPSAIHNLNANYSLFAQDISILSSFTLAASLDSPTQTSISISALGVAPDYKSGTLILNGTAQSTLSSGLASVGVMSGDLEGNVVIQCGPTGTLTLQRNIPPTPTQKIELTPEKITIDAGVEGEAFVGAKEVDMLAVNQITLESFDSITLKVDKNSITINNEGIQLQGINVKTTANLQYSLECKQEQIKVEAESTRTCPMTKMT